MTCLMEPGQINGASGAAVFSVHSESFLEVSFERNCQIEMPQTSVGKRRFNEPAMRSGSFNTTSSNIRDFSSEKTRGIHQVAAMCQHEIAALIGFWIPVRFLG